jgi:ABC-2 type transport system permease protein
MMGVKRVLRHSTWICWKDLAEFSRSKLRLVMLILMPLLMMGMVGFIFPSGTSISEQPVALANQDAGTLGNAFIMQLTIANDAYAQTHDGKEMLVLSNASGFDEIKVSIQDGKLSGGIIIPDNFTANLQAGEQGYITVVTDQSNPQISSMMQVVLSKTIEGMGMMYSGSAYNLTLAQIKPYSVSYEGIVPGDPNYFQFVAPGIIAMVVMMSLMTGLPHAISYEKDMGTLDGMLVAPINRLSIVLGKVMAQTIRGIIQAAIILTLALLLFGVVIYGSILLVIALILLTVFSFVGLGILITSFTDKEETATMVMMTLMFPMMFLSGVFFPIQQMPWYMQDVAHALPLTYASTALRKVIVLGAGLSSVWLEVVILSAFGIVLLAIAVPMFKKAMSR